MSLLPAVFARSERVVGRRVANEYILVPIVGRGADLDEIFNLNAVGAFIWERWDGRNSGEAIIRAMVDHFEVDLATAQADYQSFARKLKSINAIHAVTPTDSK